MERFNERDIIVLDARSVGDNFPAYRLLRDFTSVDYSGSEAQLDGIIGVGGFKGCFIRVSFGNNGIFVAPIVFRKNYDSNKNKQLAHEIVRDLEAQASTL